MRFKSRKQSFKHKNKKSKSFHKENRSRLKEQRVDRRLIDGQDENYC